MSQTPTLSVLNNPFTLQNLEETSDERNLSHIQEYKDKLKIRWNEETTCYDLVNKIMDHYK